jgi:hypothetical protein
MHRAPRRLAILVAAAALSLLALSPAWLPDHLALAANRGLVIVAQARYTALPDERRVHVTIDAVATSYTPNPVDGLAYYPDVTFAVQTGATHIAASSGGRQLAVSVDSHSPDFVNVTVTFQDGVFFQESYPYSVTYDLPDPGGAPDRNVRISPSIVAFPIWAFGSSGEAGGSVTVLLPGGFHPVVTGKGLNISTGPGGEIVLSTSSLPDPSAFFAYLSADRPGAFNDTLLSVQVGGKSAALKVRAWQDDPAWGTTMSALMTNGLPQLQRLIGLPYPAARVLVVEEAATSRLGEYAGIYNSLTSTIRVRYDADAYVGLHEAAHLWFNANLLPDRWIEEAYAEFYGVQAAKAIGAKGSEFNLTDALMPFKIALNDWGELGTVQTGVEEYAYAASYHVALLVFERIDANRLQAVWHGVDGGEMAYQPVHGKGPPQTGVDSHIQGWQELLDLLDQRAGANFDDLWSAWVVNPQEQALMDARSKAREHYAAVLSLAGAWNLPRDLRYAMGAWQFDQANKDLALADVVLAARDQIASQSGALHLTPPAALQQAFERTDGLAGARDQAMAELAVLGTVSKASDRLAENETILETIGLLGSDPQASLVAARSAFQTDHLDAAASAASQAFATRKGAEAAGQIRVLVGAGSLFMVTGGTLVVLRVRRRRIGTEVSAEGSESAPQTSIPHPAVSPTNSLESADWPIDPPA